MIYFAPCSRPDLVKFSSLALQTESFETKQKHWWIYSGDRTMVLLRTGTIF